MSELKFKLTSLAPTKIKEEFSREESSREDSFREESSKDLGLCD